MKKRLFFFLLKKSTDKPANCTEKMRNAAGRQRKRTPCDILSWL